MRIISIQTILKPLKNTVIEVSGYNKENKFILIDFFSSISKEKESFSYRKTPSLIVGGSKARGNKKTKTQIG